MVSPLRLPFLAVVHTLLATIALDQTAQKSGVGATSAPNITAPDYRRLLPDMVPGNGTIDLGTDTLPLLPDPAPPVLQVLELGPGSGLALKSRWLTRQNTIKAKFRQTVDGIEVFGSVVTAEYHLNGTFTGEWTGNVSRQWRPESLVPRVRARDAAAALARSFGLCPSVIDRARSLNTPLVLIPELRPNSLTLAYFVSFVVDATPRPLSVPKAPHGFVDANNKTIIQRWEGLNYQSAANATQIVGVGGNRGRLGLRTYTLNVMQLNRTACSYSSPTVQVQNMRGATTGPFAPTSFVCTSAATAGPDVVNDGYSPANDAMYYGEKVVKMYSDYLGVSSPTLMLPIMVRVGYGSSYDNAFWDSTFLNIGNGNSRVYPLTTLDIIAHELGHGFTGAFSALQQFGQSGAINEAFSDMSGQAAVYYETQGNSFVIGDNVTRNSSTGIRNMCNPRADGSSIDSALQFSSFLDVHYSCGVYNKFFCLLAQTPGWDTAKAFSLVAYANALYWGQLTNFVDGACGVKSAARDLKYRVEDVVNAFAAVNIVCPR